MRRTALAAFAALGILATAAGPALSSILPPPAVQEDFRARLERSLPEIPLSDGPALRLSLDQWMRALGVPGVSLALIRDYRVVQAEGFGVRDTESGAAVTRDTVFQAASIAKPVTAMAALRLVEEGQLSLDDPIDSYLGDWRLTAADPVVAGPVTLRDLLAHCAGITPGGFMGYLQGTETPDILTVLNGAPPAANPPARIVARPGEGSVYSGLGYVIVQRAMQERTGRDFEGLMEEKVFAPLGLRDTAFAQTPLEAWSDRAASGHRQSRQVIPGRWRAHPELAAAGLWTTAPELAAIAIEVGLTREGRSERVLSAGMTRQMLTTRCGQMGLGWIAAPDAPGGLFSHSGGNVGFTGHVRLLADTGDGVVILTNSDGGTALIGPLIGAVERGWNWPGQAPRALSLTTWLMLVDHAFGPERAVREYLALYAGTEAASPLDLILWGYALLERDRKDDALAAFHQTTLLHGDDPYVWIHQARGQIAAGSPEAARQSLNRALELEPGNEMAQEELARIEVPADGD